MNGSQFSQIVAQGNNANYALEGRQSGRVGAYYAGEYIQYASPLYLPAGNYGLSFVGSGSIDVSNDVYGQVWGSVSAGGRQTVPFAVTSGAYIRPTFKTQYAGGVTIDDVRIGLAGPPTVSIVAPNHAQVFDAPTAITLVVAVDSFDRNITEVEYFAGAVSIGKATYSPYSVVWTNAAPGTHTIVAKVKDTLSSGTVTSAAITVTINPPAAPAFFNAGFEYRSYDGYVATIWPSQPPQGWRSASGFNNDIVTNGVLTYFPYAAPEGLAVALLYGGGSIEQDVYLLPGTYQVRFKAATYAGSLTAQVRLNGAVLGTPFAPAGLFPDYTTASFTVATAGLQTIRIENTGAGGAYLALDDFRIIQPPSAPLPPINPVATAGIANATVTFNAPLYDGGNAISSYTVTSSPGGFTGTGTSSPITVNGLANTSYTFTVKATNAIGTSVASVPSNSVTPVTVPDIPTIGTATAGSGQATVTFSAPASNGGSAITRYTATSNIGNFVGTCTAPCNSIIVTGLIYDSNYSFKVHATSAIGDSAVSGASNTITPTPSAPGAPTIGAAHATTGSFQATVDFTPPVSNGGSSITGYRITSSPGNLTATGTTSPITVGGLLNNITYTFTVAATNAIGTGTASAASNTVRFVTFAPEQNTCVVPSGTGAPASRATAGGSSSSAAPMSLNTLLSGSDGTVTGNKVGEWADSAVSKNMKAANRESEASTPIKDTEGRVRYIVDLHDDVGSRRPAKFASRAELVEWHQSKSATLIEQMKRAYGIEPLSTTSLVGVSFTAYLTEEQVANLRADARVQRITRDTYLKPSAVWTDTDTTVNGQVQKRSWGVQALGGPYYSASKPTTVYVLDTGVTNHTDLPPMQRASATHYLPIVPPPTLAPSIGCFAHSTHVAGIIGALDNGVGVVGVYPGASMVSISIHTGTASPTYTIGTTTQSDGPCAIAGATSGLGVALEEVMTRVTLSGQVAIVNLSFNSGGNEFRASETMGAKMRIAATPSPDGAYPGIFIVQSAGNQYECACTYAFNATDSNDGIMVVGAIDANGQPAAPLNGVSGFQNASLASSEPGSNYGGCVEAWAPGQRIYSTFAGEKEGNWNAQSYQYLSGTSMAAPHVAGLAAFLADTLGLATSRDVEQAVRARMTLLSANVIPQPTVAFAERNSAGVMATVETLATRLHNVAIDARYDSIGAVACNLNTYLNGSIWHTENYLAHQLPSSLLPGSYRWALDCVSPHNTHSSAEATLSVTPKVSAKWQVKMTNTQAAALTESQEGPWREVTPYSLYRDIVLYGSNTFQTWTINQWFGQRYISEYADHCEVKSYGLPPDGTWFTTQPRPADGLPVINDENSPLWYGQQFPTSHWFAPLQLGNPQPTYRGYLWHLRCWNNYDSVDAYMHGKLAN